MTASVCHQSFDLPRGARFCTVAHTPKSLKHKPERERAFDSSALTKLRAAPRQVRAAVGAWEGTEATGTAVEKGGEGWRCKAQG